MTVKTSGGTTLCTDTTLTKATTDSSTYSCPISSNTLLAASGTAYTVTATWDKRAAAETRATFS